MKTLLLNLLLVATLAATGQNFQYRYALPPGVENEWHHVPLNPQIIGRSQQNLNDIRLLRIHKTDTTELPYVLTKPGKREGSSWHSVQVINRNFKKKCCSYFTLQIPETGLINRLELNVQEADFDKRLTIEGSEDGETFRIILEDARITAYSSREATFRHTAINIPPGRYKLLRVMVDDDNQARININNARVKFLWKPQVHHEAVSSRAEKSNAERKRTRFEIKLPFRTRVSLIRFVPGGTADYYRSVEVFVPWKANATDTVNRWKKINQGSITSRDTSEVNIQHVFTDILRVDIINNDNLPPDIRDIEVFSERINLYTKLAGKGDLFLYIGNDKISAPVYDIDRFTDKIPEHPIVLQPGPLESLDHSDPTLEGKPLEWWIWAVIIVVVLLLAAFSLRMLRST